MISLRLSSQSCEKDDSCYATYFTRNPFFIIPYWSTILVLTTVLLRKIIVLSVRAQHSIEILRLFLYLSQMSSHGFAKVSYYLSIAIISCLLLLTIGFLIIYMMHLWVSMWEKCCFYSSSMTQIIELYSCYTK